MKETLAGVWMLVVGFSPVVLAGLAAATHFERHGSYMGLLLLIPAVFASGLALTHPKWNQWMK